MARLSFEYFPHLPSLGYFAGTQSFKEQPHTFALSLNTALPVEMIQGCIGEWTTQTNYGDALP
jgi:hypothetical protein